MQISRFLNYIEYMLQDFFFVLVEFIKYIIDVHIEAFEKAMN